jgi:hypothetical protein
LRKLFCKSREKWQRSKVLQEQSRNISNIEHVISERFIWKLSFIEEVLAVKCFSLSIYLVLAKANKIVFLSVIISVLSQYNLLNQNHEKISFILSILLCSTAAFAQEKSDSFEAYEKCYFPTLRDNPVIGITMKELCPNMSV